MKHWLHNGYTLKRAYTLSKPTNAIALPVRLIPSLGAERRVFELQVQWDAPDPNPPRRVAEQIELLKLWVPLDWGHIKNASDHCTEKTVMAPTGEWFNEIRWEQLPISREEGKEKFCRTLALSFEEEINLDVYPPIRLWGEVVVRFKSSMSGIGMVRVFYPVGDYQQQEKEATIGTQVEADFDLSLASLRRQELRAVPDPGNPDDNHKYFKEPFERVVPDYNTVGALVTRLTERHFYVKQVIENPPGGGEMANLVSRKWDIKGRYYEGIYPIDFSLVLTGKELHNEGYAPEAARSRVSLTVSGHFAAPDNRGMKEEVERCWTTLHTIITETLKPAEMVSPLGNRGGETGFFQHININ